MTGVVAPGLKFGKLAIRCGSAGAKALVRDPQTRMAAEKFVHSGSSRDLSQVCVSLVKAGVGAGIGAVLSAKDIYEVRALRTTK